MPFADDCQEWGEPTPAASDAMRQLDRLHTVAEQLGAAELRVLLLVAERLLLGRRQYGNLDPATDPRDFRRECFEELADAAVYMAAELLRHCR
ncbi:MAG: hypothetical protein U0587_08625 [Candidatus Binatia bacterium]